MVKYILFVWLGTVNNFADYEEFNTLEECEEKKVMVMKALMQAESKMMVSCRVRYTEEKK